MSYKLADYSVMFNNIAGYCMFIVALFLVVWAIVYSGNSGNESRTFQAHITMCQDVRDTMGNETPSDVVDFCKTIDDEVKERSRIANDIDVRYLTEQAQKMRKEQ